MTNEELLKPRYKVIAPNGKHYPGSPFKDGQVLTLLQNNDYESGYMIYTERDPENYPHLFKPLHWWEEREEGQIPQYLKYENSIFKLVEIKFYAHYRGSNNIHIAVWNDRGYGPPMTACLPATESDYIHQNKEK